MFRTWREMTTDIDDGATQSAGSPPRITRHNRGPYRGCELHHRRRDDLACRIPGEGWLTSPDAGGAARASPTASASATGRAPRPRAGPSRRAGARGTGSRRTPRRPHRRPAWTARRKHPRRSPRRCRRRRALAAGSAAVATSAAPSKPAASQTRVISSRARALPSG